MACRPFEGREGKPVDVRLASPTLLQARADRVRTFTREAGADTCIITHPPNVFYLTGFSATAGAVVLAPDRLYLITDARYAAAAEALLGSEAGHPDAILVRVEDSYDDTLIDLIARLDVRRIGIEATYLPVRRFTYLSDQLQQQGGHDVIQTLRVVERVRNRKDPFEVECLGEAGRLLAALVPAIAGLVQPGRREREVAAEIDWQIRERGFDKPAFDTIVASGENSALPHARPSDRVITPGDLVLLNFGGECSTDTASI